MVTGPIGRRFWVVAGLAALPGLAALIGWTAFASRSPLLFGWLALALVASFGLLVGAMAVEFIRPAERVATYLAERAEDFGMAPPPLPKLWQALVSRVDEQRAQGRRTFDRLSETERLQRAVIAASPNALVISDQEGRILGCNPSAERFFGLRAEDAIGARMSDLITPPVLADVDPRSLQGNILDNLGEKLVAAGKRSDGTTFPVEISIFRVGTGEQTLFAAYVRDLTAQRLADAAQEEQQQRIHHIEKLSAMSSLLAGVAHELNNPLAILVTQATLLREKAPTPDVERRAERIHAAAQRAGRIVKSFLAMARHKPPVREPIQIASVIEASLELVGYGLRSAGILIERNFDPQLPLVAADRDLMGQVFANLIINAQQALVDTPEPKRIAITTAFRDGSAVIEVLDNGSGVSEAAKDRIFEPYFTTKPVGAGTGIGLSICSRVIRDHGGRIELADHAGEGALFRITLPVSSEVAEDGVPSRTRSPKAMSVLVVDDETEVADALAELINLFGHRTVVLSSGMDALDRIRQQAFDAVFTDLRMPGMSGLSLRHAIADLDQHLARKTVIMTGDTVVAAHRESGVELPLDGLVLEKPFTAESLRSLLDRMSAS